MSLLASLGLFLLYALIALPGLSLLSRWRAVMPTAVFYGVLGVALGAYHLGMPRRAQADLLRPVPTLLGDQGAAAGLCGQVLAQVRQAGIIIDRPNSRQVRVRRDDWGQLPDEVKQAITTCLNAPDRPGGASVEVEVVQVAR